MRYGNACWFMSPEELGGTRAYQNRLRDLRSAPPIRTNARSTSTSVSANRIPYLPHWTSSKNKLILDQQKPERKGRKVKRKDRHGTLRRP